MGRLRLARVRKIIGRIVFHAAPGRPTNQTVSLVGLEGKSRATTTDIVPTNHTVLFVGGPPLTRQPAVEALEGAGGGDVFDADVAVVAGLVDRGEDGREVDLAAAGLVPAGDV